eukprot:gene17622-9015_t
MGSSCSKPNEDAAVEMIEHHKSRASTIILHEAETSGDDAPTGWCCCGPREKNVGGYHVAGHEAGILSHSSSRRLSLPAGMVVEDYAENNSGSGEDDVPCDAHPAPRRAPSFGRDGPFPVIPATSSTDPFASPSNDGSSRGGGGKHLISVALPLQQSTKERIFGKSSRTSPDQTAAKEPSTGFPSGLGPIIIRWDVAVELSWSGPCGSIQDTTMTDVTKAGALNCRYHVVGPPETILGARSLGLGLSGMLTQRTPLTIPTEARKEGGIPKNAVASACAFPCEGAEKVTFAQLRAHEQNAALLRQNVPGTSGVVAEADDFDDRLRFLLYGGFVYFNEDAEIVQINGFNTLAAGDAHAGKVARDPIRKVMHFQMGLPLLDSIDAILVGEQRYQPVRPESWRAAGAAEVCFLPRGDFYDKFGVQGSTACNTHGSFVFRFNTPVTQVVAA